MNDLEATAGRLALERTRPDMLSTVARAGGRVLLVDDDEAQRFMVEAVVRDGGFDCIAVPGGEEALAAFAREPIALVLLDVLMPGMDGFETCAAIRALPAGRFVPVMMMTGLDDVDSIERAYELGATDFLTKPINYVLLQHRLRYMVRAAVTGRELRASEARLETAQRLAGVGHWEWQPDSGQLHCSETAAELFDLIDGQTLESLAAFERRVHPDDAAAVAAGLAALAGRATPLQLSHRVLTAAGEVRFVRQEARRASGGQSGIRFVGMVQDITELRVAEEQAHRMTYYDAVTNLANRALLTEELGKSVAVAVRTERAVAVISIGIDHFKRINETLGYDAGNGVLRAVADRLDEATRLGDHLGRSPSIALRVAEGALVARISGDEFMVVLNGLISAEDAASAARRFREVIAEPLQVAGEEIVLTSSMGIAVCPLDGDQPERLIELAESAMHHAKDEGRDCYQFYARSINVRAFERFTLETNLRKGIANNEFEVYYQPKVALADDRVVGAEALLRWRHPDLGLVSPTDFIPVAEETNLILPLGDWVVQQACRDAASWHAQGFENLQVAVNLSPVQMSRADLFEVIAGALEAAGLPAWQLEIEITESALMDRLDDAVRFIQNLRALGVEVWIDDFGTGYSSLAYITQLPISGLKIDRAFVREMDTRVADASVVAAIVRLAERLDLRVVAEGVERQSHVAALIQEGNVVAQGFLYSPPLPGDKFVAWLRERSRRRPTRQ